MWLGLFSDFLFAFFASVTDVFAVCAGESIRREVEHAARPNISGDLRLVNLSLEPAAEWTGDESPSRPQETTEDHRSGSSTSRPPGNI
jgi:hypothetical protein